MDGTLSPGDSADDSTQKSTVTKRWKLLASAIRRAHQDVADGAAVDGSDVSVMRFKSFGLITPSSNAADDGERLSTKSEDFSWITYASTVETLPFSVRIRIIQAPTSLSDMMGFNNTGNVCVWPSEEVLAYYCLCQSHLFEGKSVCELGAGMAGLAGIAVAKSSKAKDVLLTDGNTVSVQNLHACVKANSASFKTTLVDSQVLVWNRADKLEERANRFDVVIAADCLFFTDYHIDLLHVLVTLLKPRGHAIIIGPHRAGSLRSFMRLAENSRVVRVELIEHFNDEVMTRHADAVREHRASNVYDPDIHQPVLLKIFKL
eukprot:m.309864 g.309864  ORF g.309864 m.309864 type:complete len:318 (+) comp20204_c0_seq7:61-1014(+)